MFERLERLEPLEQLELPTIELDHSMQWHSASHRRERGRCLAVVCRFHRSARIESSVIRRPQATPLDLDPWGSLPCPDMITLLQHKKSEALRSVIGMIEIVYRRDPRSSLFKLESESSTRGDSVRPAARPDRAKVGRERR